METSLMKINELAQLSGISKPTISRYFKDADENLVKRINSRVIGISPDGITQFLNEHDINCFNKGAIFLLSNLCGGVGKTSGTFSLAVCTRRIVDESQPVVIVDTDSQGSLSKSVTGSPARNDEPILIDFLEGKADLKSILTNLNNNTWIVKSNLNQVYMDKVLAKPSDIKKGMLEFYQQVFDLLGENTKIFQDHTPQLSSIFASSILALCQLPKSILKAVVIPMRADAYAVEGAEKIINEVNEIKETFNFETEIPLHCFFSSIDKRIATTSTIVKEAQGNPLILNHLLPVAIRYSAEVIKTTNTPTTNIYSSGKANKPAEDYRDLLQYLFSYQSPAGMNENGTIR